MPLAMKTNIPQHDCWDVAGEGDTHLAPLINCIFAQVCSSLWCQRNYSYSFVYNKARNWLSVARADNFVYVYTNAQLAGERFNHASATWYLMNMMSDNLPAGPNGDSLVPLNNNSDNEHNRGTWALTIPMIRFHLMVMMLQTTRSFTCGLAS